MYRHHFGLQDKPFRIVPSPRFLFASETHDEGRARMLYGIREGRGFVVVTGQIGLGKTTILMSVLEELDPSMRTAFIFNPVDTYEQLLRMIADEFGIEAEESDEVSLMRDLNLFLLQAMSRGESCVLLIDEAQNLSVEVLEKIRLLSNLQTEEASLLQIVLVGQPELHDKLHDRRLVQLRQRVGVWYEIQPLDREETEDYILHRLRLAGARRPKDIFPIASCRRVHRYADGIPRVVNQICDTALVIAFGRNAEQVDTGHVDEAAQELQLVSPEVGRRHAGGREEETQQRLRRRGWFWRPRWHPALATGMILVFAIAIAVLAGWKWRLWPPGFLGAAEHAGLATRVTEPATPAPAEVSSQDMDTAETSLAGAGTLPATAGKEISPAGSTETLQEEALPSPGTGASESVASSGDPVLEAALVRMDPQRAAVESWREAGRPVYSVHLASFKDADAARGFARQLVGTDASWSAPLYVDVSGDQPPWYRVLVGAFRDRSAAVAWARELKTERSVAYAQVTRLGGDATFLLQEPPASGQGKVSGAEG